MDNVTHALAGCLLASVTLQLMDRRSGETSRVTRRAVFAVGIVAAELPDIDIVYSGESLGLGPLGYLLHHRGHTHTIVFAIAAAVLIWSVAVAASTRLRAPPLRTSLLGLAIAGTLSHIALDYTNSYGVHPFWPLDNRWFYGDAAFIVEPWFWVLSIPALFMVATSRIGRGVYTALFALILGAVWAVDLVSTGTAAAVTGGAVLWSLLTVLLKTPGRRTGAALAGWAIAEAGFFMSSAAARKQVMQSAVPGVTDIVLSPHPGNPFCHSAIVVSTEAGVYTAREASVAGFPQLVPASDCRAFRQSLEGRGRAGSDDHPGIHWGGSWSGSVTELAGLMSTHCEVRAALRFMRVPIWSVTSEGDVRLFDLRYGDGSFASLTARHDATCRGWIPPWHYPAAEVLAAN